MPTPISETKEHASLKETIVGIAIQAGFKFDKEVHFNFTGAKDEKGNLVDEKSIDVAVWGEIRSKKFLFLFECKGGSNLSSPKKDIQAWDGLFGQFDKVKIIKSDSKKIRFDDLQNCEIRFCYVIGSKDFDSQRYENFQKNLRGYPRFFSWDANALEYYKRGASTVGKWIKYEIFREFSINFETVGIWKERAIEIKQDGYRLYLMGVYPSVLLKIGYVSRRASGKGEAYQRILNKDRIQSISKFLSLSKPLLPNAIILAFDADAEIQKNIKFDGNELTFPSKYCSAWVIDGQHRMFGFTNTKYEDVDASAPTEDFKLPVVAFIKLDPAQQNRTFVSINYYQKKIDPTLLCDLAASITDLKNELTWPSLLVTSLNKIDPLRDKVKISELDTARPITLSSFAQYGLLEGLLGYDKKNQIYKGRLFTYKNFFPKKSLNHQDNKLALEEHVKLLNRFFEGVKYNTAKKDADKDPWRNTRKYALLKPTGINALLLVLSRILEKHPRAALDFKTYLAPFKKMRFQRGVVANHGGGWKGFRGLANTMLDKLNAAHSNELNSYRKKEKH